jgi:hypothetical protein
MPPMMYMPYGYWMGAPGFEMPFAQPYGDFIYMMPAQPAWPQHQMRILVMPPFAGEPIAPGAAEQWFEFQPPAFIQATPAEPLQVQPAPVEVEIVADEAI